MRAFVLSLLLPLAAHAQSIPYRDAAFDYSDRSIPPRPDATLDLRAPNGRSVGSVSFEHWRNGVLAIGRVNGPRGAGRVNLWIATSDAVDMPEIGWSNRFGDTNCSEYLAEERPPQSPQACAAWEARQVLHREQLRRLFVRQWQFAPNATTEVLASDAYKRLIPSVDDFYLKDWRFLEPKLARTYFQSGGEAQNWQFTAFLPWAALPPANVPDLKNLYVVAEIVDGTQIRASSSPEHKGDPAAFTHLTFDRPQTFRITGCEFPLKGWYFPTDNGIVFDQFFLANRTVGYRYDPEGLSPEPIGTHHFGKQLSSNEFVCGPRLHYVVNGRVWESESSIDGSKLEHRRLPDGSYLLKSGPTEGTAHPLGVGAGGADTMYVLSVHHLDPQKGITKSFSDAIVVTDEDTAGDIQVSEDWRTVTVYKGKRKDAAVEWSSTRHCYSGGVFEVCGEGPSGPPPSPRNIVLQ